MKKAFALLGAVLFILAAASAAAVRPACARAQGLPPAAEQPSANEQSPAASDSGIQARSDGTGAGAAADTGTPAGTGTSGLNAAPAEADTPAGNAAPEEPAPYQYDAPDFSGAQVSYPMMVLRTIAIMGVVIIGLFVLYRVVLRKKNRLVADSEVVSVLATYPLAANRIIQVVDIAGQILVLGVSDASINLIVRIEDQETIDRIKLLSSRSTSGAGGFKEQLLKLLGGGLSLGKGQGSGTEGAGSLRPGHLSYLRGYRKRVERMRKMK